MGGKALTDLPCMLEGIAFNLNTRIFVNLSYELHINLSLIYGEDSASNLTISSSVEAVFGW